MANDEYSYLDDLSEEELVALANRGGSVPEMGPQQQDPYGFLDQLPEDMLVSIANGDSGALDKSLFQAADAPAKQLDWMLSIPGMPVSQPRTTSFDINVKPEIDPESPLARRMNLQGEIPSDNWEVKQWQKSRMGKQPQYDYAGRLIMPGEDRPSPGKPRRTLKDVVTDTNYDPIAGAKILAQGVPRAAMSGLASFLQALQGPQGVDVVNPGWSDRFIASQEEKNKQFTQDIVQEHGEDKNVLPFLTAKDISEFPSNVGFSGVSMAAGAGAALPFLLSPEPITKAGAPVAGMAAAGVAAQRMAAGQIMREYLTEANRINIEMTGQPLTREQQEEHRNKFAWEANKFGLWEAIPEAAGETFQVMKLLKPLAKTVGSNMALKILNKVGSVYGSELLTETVTQMGQQGIQARAGLGDGEAPRSFTDPSAWLKSMQEVAPQVFLMSTLMTGIGGGIYGLRKKFDDNQTSQVVQDAMRSPEWRTMPDQVMTQVRQGLGEFAATRPGDQGLLEAIKAFDLEVQNRLQTKALPPTQDFIEDQAGLTAGLYPGRIAGPTEPLVSDPTIAQAQALQQTPALPAGQGFDLVQPAPETVLRKAPEEYPRGAQFVAGQDVGDVQVQAWQKPAPGQAPVLTETTGPVQSPLSGGTVETITPVNVFREEGPEYGGLRAQEDIYHPAWLTKALEGAPKNTRKEIYAPDGASVGHITYRQDPDGALVVNMIRVEGDTRKGLASQALDQAVAETGATVIRPDKDGLTDQGRAFFKGYAKKNGWDYNRGQLVKQEAGLQAQETFLPPENYPKKTVKGYKVFDTMPSRPGEIFPVMDRAFEGPREATRQGVWMQAEAKKPRMVRQKDGSYKPGLAEHPGWHGGLVPDAPHLFKGKAAANRVWAEVEYPADVDWQEQADATKKGYLSEVPHGGHYQWKTHGQGKSPWVIAGAIKVNKILTPEEVAKIRKEHGLDLTAADRTNILNEGATVESVKAKLNELGIDKDNFDEVSPTTGKDNLQRSGPLGDTGAFRTIASSVRDQFIQRGFINHIGQKIKGPADLATIAQIYADPTVETQRLFYTKGGRIVGWEGWTSGKVDAVLFSESPADTNVKIQRINQMADGLGADGVWIVHNHPSGDPQPSPADMRLTEMLGASVPRIQGHVIIDHENYGVIRRSEAPSGFSSEVKPLSANMKKVRPPVSDYSDPKLGINVSDPSKLAQLGRDLQVDKDQIYFIFLSTKLTTKGIQESSTIILNDFGKTSLHLEMAKENFGSYFIAAVMSSKTIEGLTRQEMANLYQLANNGQLLDIVTDSGFSARDNNQIVTHPKQETLTRWSVKDVADAQAGLSLREISPPYGSTDKRLQQWIDNLSPEARATHDMFRKVLDAGGPLKTTIKDVGKRVNPLVQFMTTQNWNRLVKSNWNIRQAAQRAYAAIPAEIRDQMKMKRDGTFELTDMEKAFRVSRSVMQRLVDAMPMEMIEPTMTLPDGRTISISEHGTPVAVAGGEALRQAIRAERIKMFQNGTLKRGKVSKTNSRDPWGVLNFLTPNEKTVASGDFSTMCPQIFYNRGCFYCYRIASMKDKNQYGKGVNNKLGAYRIWYTADILSMGQEAIDLANRSGGLRVQSFGDFDPMHRRMIAEMVADAEAVGLQVKIITKQPDMIEFLAHLKNQGVGNNIFFNLSTDYVMERQGKSGESTEWLELNSNRPWTKRMNPTTGKNEIWWKRALAVDEADQIRQKYPWVNIRIVATDVEEFIRGLQDPRVSVVTGYHGILKQDPGIKGPNFERVDSETGQVKVTMEPIGDNGMPTFDLATGKINFPGKKRGHKKLAKEIERLGLQKEYYAKSCCITGKCPTCTATCGVQFSPIHDAQAKAQMSGGEMWDQELAAIIENEMNDAILFHAGIPLNQIGDYAQQIYQDLKGVSTAVAEFFLPGKDMSLLRKFFMPPQWIAKYHPKAGELYRRQIKRQEDRLESFYTAMDGARPMFDLKQADLKQLSQLIWMAEGKKFARVTSPWYQVTGQDQFGRNIYALNPAHYTELAQALPALKSIKLNPDVITSFVAMRRQMDQAWIDILESMRRDPDIEVSELEEAARQLGKVHNYFPHHRYGNYALRVWNGKTLEWRQHFNIKGADYEAAKKNLKIQFPGARIEELKVRQLPEEIYEFPIPKEAMQQIIDTAAARLQGMGHTSQVVDALRKDLTQSVGEVIKTRGFGKHTIHREGIPGFETEDIVRVYVNYMSGLYGWKTKMEAARDMSVTLRSMDPATTEYRWGTKYMRDMLENSTRVDQVMDTIRGLAFLKYIAGVVKTGFVNLTQNVLAAGPRLTQDTQMGDLYLTKAMADIPISLANKKYLKPTEQAMLDELWKTGSTQSKMVREWMGRLDGPSKRVFNKTVTILGSTMGIPEAYNRMSTALAAYRLAVDGRIGNAEAAAQYGIQQPYTPFPHDQAVAYAKQIVEDSHFETGKANRPELFRGSDTQKLLAGSYIYQNFAHNLLNLYRYLGHSLPGAFGLVKAGAGMLALGGVKFGIPGMFLGAAMVRKMFGVDPLEEVRDLIPLTNTGSTLWKDLVTYGLPAGLGIVIGQSIMVGPRLGQNVDVNKPLGDQLGSVMAELGGVPVSMVVDAGNALSAMAKGQPLRGLEKVSPRFIAQGLTASREYVEGKRKGTGQPVVLPGETEPVKLSAGDALLMGATGFQPLERTKATDVQTTIRDLTTYRQGEVSQLINEAAQGLQSKKDPQAFNRALQALIELSDSLEKKGLGGISAEQARTGIKSRLQGVQPPKYMMPKAVDIRKNYMGR